MSRKLPANPLTLVLFLCSYSIADAQCAPPNSDFNNTYLGSDGGKYYMTQYGSDIWWIGLSKDGGKRFANVFRGTLAGNVISGEWADTTFGSTHNHGVLKLLVTGNSQLKTMEMTGGFSGMTWSLFAPCADTQSN